MNNLLNLFRGVNPMALLAQLQGNPMQALRSAGFNVPQNMNNPQAIVQYLAQSGQVSQQQLNMAQQLASQWNK